jgi:hypothetical protein
MSRDMMTVVTCQPTTEVFTTNLTLLRWFSLCPRKIYIARQNRDFVLGLVTAISRYVSTDEFVMRIQQISCYLRCLVYALRKMYIAP